MSEIPEIDRAWIDLHYEELVSLQVELDADPLAFGPKRLNGKIAHARTMLARCERVFLQVSQYLQHFKRDFRMAEIELKVLKDDLFVKDPEVKAGRTHSERDAIASSKLEKEVKRLHYLELAVADLEAVLDVVKAKRSDLRDTQARLRDQVKLCQEEIGLGSKWSTRPTHDIELKPGQGQAAVQAFEKLLEDIEVDAGEIHLPPLEEEIVDSVPETETTGTEIPVVQVQDFEKIEMDSSEEEEEDEEQNIPTTPDVDIEAFFASPDSTLGDGNLHKPVEVDIDGLIDLFSQP